MSFDKSTHDISEGDGSIDLTLQLTKPIPFTNNTLQLVIDDSNDHTASKLWSVCGVCCVLCLCLRVHACVCMCLPVCMCKKIATVRNAYPVCVVIVAVILI